MAYEMVMPYHLHMPSYFLETFTEYPYFSSLKIDNEGADYDNHSCNGTECRILSREHDPAKYGAQYRVDQSAHIDITHFGSFTL